ELREMRLSGTKPPQASAASAQQAIYKGPFKQVVDDAGNVYACGRLAAADDLRASLQREAFEKHCETVQ
ncbi:MAG TPA: hypothetical protein VHC19_24350, partial [Pirellulales bacterium]|nr:hypothetical protein [Pirellulales bacterium]